MRSSTAVDQQLAEAAAFGDSVAGVLAQHRVLGEPAWAPGRTGVETGAWKGLDQALEELGWPSVAQDPELVACAGLGGAALGRLAAPLRQLDRLLGASPLAGEWIRGEVPGGMCLQRLGGALVACPILQSRPSPSADGLDVHQVVEFGPPQEVDAEAWAIAKQAWLAASVGYLAGLGEAALELTVKYVGQRSAFGGTLGGLGAVQQLLADAATAARGVSLLCAHAPDADALGHSGRAIARVCGNCQQVSGAIAFTLEYPLHGFTQRARALAVWNDAVLEIIAE